jgi:hypothetical protein
MIDSIPVEILSMDKGSSLGKPMAMVTLRAYPEEIWESYLLLLPESNLFGCEIRLIAFLTIQKVGSFCPVRSKWNASKKMNDLEQQESLYDTDHPDLEPRKADLSVRHSFPSVLLCVHFRNPVVYNHVEVDLGFPLFLLLGLHFYHRSLAVGNRRAHQRGGFSALLERTRILET